MADNSEGPLTLAAHLLSAPLSYNQHLKGQDARTRALTEASHGAAMIVLPVVILITESSDLLPWVRVAIFAMIGWGIIRLFKNAMQSYGMRDPELIMRFSIKIGLGLAVWHYFDVNFWLSLLGWWLVVTGGTKVYLVMRGYPKFAPISNNSYIHGNAPFTLPDDPGWN